MLGWLRLLRFGGVLAKPKALGGGLVALALVGFALHYSWLRSQRAAAEQRTIELTQMVRRAEHSARQLTEELHAERQAAAEGRAERDAARAALVSFRRARTDEASREWAARRIPDEERRRLCAALPGTDGCADKP